MVFNSAQTFIPTRKTNISVKINNFTVRYEHGFAQLAGRGSPTKKFEGSVLRTGKLGLEMCLT